MRLRRSRPRRGANGCRVTGDAPCYRVDGYSHIDEIPPDLWDSFLEPDDLQATHRFIKICEDSEVERARYLHLLVHHGGRLEAVASLSLMDIRLDLLVGRAARFIVAAARTLYPRLLRTPILMCGLPVSFGASWAHAGAPAPSKTSSPAGRIRNVKVNFVLCITSPSLVS